MSEPNGKPPVDPAVPDPATGVMPKITLTITYWGGNVNVDGPLDDSVFCYGLLEIARMEVFKYKERQRFEAAQRAAAGQTPGGLYTPGAGVPPHIPRG